MHRGCARRLLPVALGFFKTSFFRSSQILTIQGHLDNSQKFYSLLCLQTETEKRKKGASSSQGYWEWAEVSHGGCISFTPCGSWFLQDKFFLKSLFDNSRKFYSLLRPQTETEKRRSKQLTRRVQGVCGGCTGVGKAFTPCGSWFLQNKFF